MSEQEITDTPVLSEAPRLAPERRFERWMSLGLGISFVLVLLYVAYVRIGVKVDVAGVLLSERATAWLGVAKSGTVGEIFAHDQELVARGETLLVIEHPRPGAQEMEALLAQRRSKLAEKIEKLHTRSKIQPLPSAQLTELEDQYEMSLLDTDNRLQSVRSGGRTIVAAPRTGRLIDLRVRAGDNVREGQVLAAIIDDSPRYRVVAYVPTSKASKLTVGTRATASIENKRWETPLVIEGKVQSISRLPVIPREIDPQLIPKGPMNEVEIAIDEKAIPQKLESRLTPGMIMQVKLHASDKTIGAWLLDRFDN